MYNEKKLPIGIENYLTAQEYYYVDKTLLIRDLIQECVGKSVLFTRPTRFGKSLNLSMIEYFFSNKLDSNSCFNDKLIFKCSDDCKSYLNALPVIRLNFKNIYATTFNNLMNSIKREISSLYRSFPELSSSDKLFEIEKNNYLNIANEKYDDYSSYVTAIKDLSLYLYRHYTRKVVILIDKYDQPMEQAFEKGYYSEVFDFFKVLFSSCLKGNDSCFFSVISGEIEVSKESLFSGLNNLVLYSGSDRNMIEYFGFTTSEVKNLLEYYEIDEDVDEIRKWYGGYGTKDVEIFNPWSILNFIDKKRFGWYWVNTGTNSMVKAYINKLGNDGVSSKELLGKYINNEKCKFTFNNSVSFTDLNGTIEPLLSFLVQTGYLSVNECNDAYFVAKIPNKEVMEIFEKELFPSESSGDSLSLCHELKKSIKENNTPKIGEILNKFILSSFSYFDLVSEKDYQLITMSLLSVLFDEYIVKSEVNNRFGRCDIMIRPKTGNDLGIIVELKKYKNTISKDRLKEYADHALNQINDREYYSELQTQCLKKIMLYAFVFDDRHSYIKSNEIKVM